MPNLTDDQKLLRNQLEPVRLVMYNTELTEEDRGRQLTELLRDPIILTAATEYKKSFENIPGDLRSSWMQSWIEDNPSQTQNPIAERYALRLRQHIELHTIAQHAAALAVRNASRRTAQRIQQQAVRRVARQFVAQISRDATQETERETMSGPSRETIPGPLREPNHESTQEPIAGTAQETEQEPNQGLAQETEQVAEVQAMDNNGQQTNRSELPPHTPAQITVRRRRVRAMRPSERAEYRVEILRAQPPERFIPAEERVIERRPNPAPQRLEEEEGEQRILQQPNLAQLPVLPPSPLFPSLERRQARALHLRPPRQPQRRPLEPLHLPIRPLVLGRPDIEILSEIIGILHDPEIAQEVKIDQIIAMLRTSPVLWDMYNERQRMRQQRRSNHRTG